MESGKLQNRLRGKQNHSSGAELEKIIEAANSYYHKAGIAEIQKTPEAMRIIANNKNGTFTAVFTKKSQPDFKGIRRPRSGRGRPVSLIFDAKFTLSDRIRDEVLTSEQRAVFDSYAALGADAFLLVSFGFKLYYMVPWEVWRRMKEDYGRKYLLPDEMSPFRVTMRRGILDYLGLIAEERSE